MTTESSRGLPVVTPLPVDFRAFHQLKRPGYVRWAELHLGSLADAEIAADWAFEQLAVLWPDVLAMENPDGYAWTVLKHRTIDIARARRRLPIAIDVAAFETHALHTAVDPIGELEESLAIYQAIRGLPERQHDVIVLRYCLGYTTTETADILGISVATVRSTARYAKRRLQHALGLTTEGNADDLAD